VVKAKRDTVSLHKKGKSPQEIAEALGRSSRTIYLYLQEARDEGLIE
jgi:transposase